MGAGRTVGKNRRPAARRRAVLGAAACTSTGRTGSVPGPRALELSVANEGGQRTAQTTRSAEAGAHARGGRESRAGANGGAERVERVARMWERNVSAKNQNVSSHGARLPAAFTAHLQSGRRRRVCCLVSQLRTRGRSTASAARPAAVPLGRSARAHRFSFCKAHASGVAVCSRRWRVQDGSHRRHHVVEGYCLAATEASCGTCATRP